MTDTSTGPSIGLGLPPGIRACLFDMDGVLTQTSVLHRSAWKHTFDPLLAERGLPEFTDHDYAEFVDGRPRADGVRGFLLSRGIVLPEGTPLDPETFETIGGVAQRKNAEVQRRLDADGVMTYPGSMRYLREVRDAGLATGVVTASANGAAVLAAAGIGDLLDVRIDGIVAERDGLAGKPAPDTFLAAAAALGIPREQTAVFEDAVAGVTAGRTGQFGFVVGVDRLDQADRLREAGADVVVADLALLLEPQA
jgi:beta-phosphoglucomutase family hydrolase